MRSNRPELQTLRELGRGVATRRKVREQAIRVSARSFASSIGSAIRQTTANFRSPNVTIGFKEVIQPQVPLRLPCYDLVPVMNHTVVTVLPKVRLATSGAAHSHDLTGGVYKARERIHRDMLIRDY